jgi:histidinol-phosphate aminotransferase
MPPQDKVLKQLCEGAKQCHRYPDSLKGLKEIIGRLNGLDPQCVLIANGSNEAIDMAMRSFLKPGDSMVQSNPCYGIYAQRAALIGAKTISIDALEDWEYDLKGIETAIGEDTKIVVVANPNNPTGNLAPDDVFEHLAAHNVVVICDEAYIEYSGLKNSKLDIMKRNPNMIISRTLSKAYGLAGMRFGYLLGHPEIIQIISRMIMFWNVSTISAFGAAAALLDQEGLKKKTSTCNEGRDYLERELAKINGLTVYHSEANYILIDATGFGENSKEIVDGVLRKHGIILRPVKPFREKTGMVRITIGNTEENERCVAALTDYFSTK